MTLFERIPSCLFFWDRFSQLLKDLESPSSCGNKLSRRICFKNLLWCFGLNMQKFLAQKILLLKNYSKGIKFRGYLIPRFEKFYISKVFNFMILAFSNIFLAFTFNFTIIPRFSKKAQIGSKTRELASINFRNFKMLKFFAGI